MPSRLPVVLAALVAAAGLILAALALTATADNDEAAELPPRSTSGPTSTSGVAVDASTTAPPTTDAEASSTATTRSSTTSSTGATTSTTEPPPERNLLGGDSPEDGLMPDLVCFDLQAAQDEVQDHGVFFSRSEDASGNGRRQLWDRNWVVIDQDPAPGTPIGERDAVFYVLKDDEPHGC